MRTEARRREERAFEMRARDPGRALTAWQRAERPAQHLLARRDEDPDERRERLVTVALDLVAQRLGLGVPRGPGR